MRNRKITAMIAGMGLYAFCLFPALCPGEDESPSESAGEIDGDVLAAAFFLLAMLPLLVTSATCLWILGEKEFRTRKFFAILGLSLPVTTAAVGPKDSANTARTGDVSLIVEERDPQTDKWTKAFDLQEILELPSRRDLCHVVDGRLYILSMDRWREVSFTKIK